MNMSKFMSQRSSVNMSMFASWKTSVNTSKDSVNISQKTLGKKTLVNTPHLNVMHMAKFLINSP